MAMELVGGAFLSSFFGVLLDRIASSKVVDFFNSHKLDVGMLNYLAILLNSVHGVLNDAEENQISKPAVKNWLGMLKVAVYEVDDFLDEVAYEALQVEAEFERVTDQAQSSFWGKKFQKMTEEKSEGITNEQLKSLIDRLEKLLRQKDVLGLRQVAGDKSGSQKVATTSRVDESGVYGRDKDKEAVNKLLQLGDTSGNDLDVIPIVGLGGVGKTTLAQLIYNDNDVQEWFDLQAWVCVSEDYNVFRIAKEILKTIGSLSCDSMTPDQLHKELEVRLEGKKFLLVLDDVWNEKYEDWSTMKTPLKSAAHGSKIIVTTCKESVASIMRTIPSSYQLRELGDDDCWLLFAKHAFSDGVVDPNLEGIGKEIVRKCGGLPLAAKILGGLLRCERNEAKWKKIAMSNMWKLSNPILPSLRISYQYLPSKLKQLFSYCAIFPKDHPFEKENLILLWMAEGFLVEAGEEKEMEAAGYEYFDQLVSASLFQQCKSGSGSSTSFVQQFSRDSSSFVQHSSRGSSLFIMHDLVNDLAKSVGEGFSTSLEGFMLSKIPKTTRHLSCVFNVGVLEMNILKFREAKQLSTLLLGSSGHPLEVANLLVYLRRLRVLSSCIIDLPNLVDNFKHLRYLNLRCSPIRNLPDTICALYNLQTLILFGCKDLAELPMQMGMLINLTYLDICGTDSLKEMPPHMDRLKKLQLLTDFVVGQRGADSIKELRDLHHLGGALHIRNLENVVDSSNSGTLKDILKDKAHLEELKLEWNGAQDTLNERKVLEQLQPHVNIKRLSIFNYLGGTSANWIGHSTFSNIVFLQLHGCENCLSLPPLGQLESLKELSISSFNAVTKLGPEFLRSSNNSIRKPFQSLKYLNFENMSQWQEWIIGQDDEVEAFPNLQCLRMIGCPKLKSLPNLPPLEVLNIKGDNELELVDVLPLAQKIRSLEIGRNFYRCLSSEFLDNGLLSISIAGWERSLNSMAQHGLCGLLEEIKIFNDDALDSIKLELFPHLKTLYVNLCRCLESIDPPAESGPYLNYLEIQNCRTFSMSNLVDMIQKFQISHPSPSRALSTFQKLKVVCGSSSVVLEKLPSGMYRLKNEWKEKAHSFSPIILDTVEAITIVEEVQIQSCSFKCLLLELFPRLKMLEISNCRNLASLSSRAIPLDYLTSLVVVKIRQCHSLVSFPEGGLPAPNLATFWISNCSNLKSLPTLMHLLLPSLVHLHIDNCPELEFFPGGNLPSKLQALCVHQCYKLMAGRAQWDLQNCCPSISEFKFQRYVGSDVHSFPEARLLPSSLKYFVIQGLKNLKFLNHLGLAHLTSLDKFKIIDCPKLQYLPEAGLPTSLSSLVIQGCPLLARRCQPENGEDWPKISHISHIEINSRTIQGSKFQDEVADEYAEENQNGSSSEYILDSDISEDDII